MTQMAPRVFLSQGHEKIPPQFNAVTIQLQIGPKSNLKWTHEKKLSQDYIEAGFKLVFDFEMGPMIATETHLLTLQLGIDQFKQDFAKFFESSLGAIIYKGKLPSEDELNFLKILISALPDEMMPFLLLEANDLNSLLQFFLNEDLIYFSCAVKGIENWPYAFPFFGFEHGISPLGYFGRSEPKLLPPVPIKNGLCLSHGMESRFLDLVPKPFRVIPEWVLTDSWEGLDTLYISREHLSPQGLRKVLGFEAAGGSVVELH